MAGCAEELDVVDESDEKIKRIFCIKRNFRYNISFIDPSLGISNTVLFLIKNLGLYSGFNDYHIPFDFTDICLIKITNRLLSVY